MTKITWQVHADPAQLALALAEDLRGRIERAVAARGRALIVLPGGVTPLPAFELLASAVSVWDHVTIIPSDDRLMPLDSPMSNAAMLMRCFADKGARVVPLADDSADYKQAGYHADARLREYDWPPDFVWLGMGTDGHAASLFPGPDLEAALYTSARAIGGLPNPLPPEAPVSRVTLSLSAFAEASALLLVITGAAKRAVIERAIAEGVASGLPVAHVLAAVKGPITVYWSP